MPDAPGEPAGQGGSGQVARAVLVRLACGIGDELALAGAAPPPEGEVGHHQGLQSHGWTAAFQVHERGDRSCFHHVVQIGWCQRELAAWTGTQAQVGADGGVGGGGSQVRIPVLCLDAGRAGESAGGIRAGDLAVAQFHPACDGSVSFQHR